MILEACWAFVTDALYRCIVDVGARDPRICLFNCFSVVFAFVPGSVVVMAALGAPLALVIFNMVTNAVCIAMVCMVVVRSVPENLEAMVVGGLQWYLISMCPYRTRR